MPNSLHDSITIVQGAIVCADSAIRGAVTIGAGTVVHPQCQIIAERGPITIGENNIIAECTRIINRSEEPLVIGHYNTLEVASGNYNVIEARGRVLAGTTLGDFCVITPACSTLANEHVPDKTVIYGEAQDRRLQTEDYKSQLAVYIKHLKYLQDMLPRYNHLRKSTI
ncbi:hypothetical protein IWQ60_000822 [Tieghemiomyces parasiticus]|uniref:Dynactin subunit 6 n=1 Tax=Tieghemiomyces parasiticus TaxID=78921 RepID=A0A9W8E340_9FUNG|nr:hypothetical protein IWQ60_000822 [Tieghemiomyces parasiticus]